MWKAMRGGVWMLTILAIASLAISVANAQVDTSSTEYQTAYNLSLEAFKYGLPLVTMQWTYDNQTSKVAVNNFNYFRTFASPDDTTILGPNFDTLYSMAWLDLSLGPIIITVPDTTVFGGRYWSIPLYDPYSEVIITLGSVIGTKKGEYAVVGPNWFLPLPGKTIIRSRYNRVWVIERIYANVNDASDVAYVNTLQNMITLKRWIPLPGVDQPTGLASAVMPTGMAYFDELCKQLEMFPPPGQDYPYIFKFLEIGVGIGLKPSTNPLLSPNKVAAMIAAVSIGPKSVLADAQAMYAKDFAAHNGYLIEKTGNYGTNYPLRAIACQIGLGAQTPDQAIYPTALVSARNTPLVGSNNYIVRIPAGGLPPVQPSPLGFWSLTAYTTANHLIPNALHRYNVNDRSNLVKNATDGSVTIYIQSTPPAIQENWLPTPANGGPFELIWRMYATLPSAIDPFFAGTDYKLPPVLPV